MMKQTVFILLGSFFLFHFVGLSNHFSTNSRDRRDAFDVQVPMGKHILIDGRVGDKEWADAEQMQASPATRLYFKRDNTYLYLAVKPSTPARLSIDLYFRGSEAQKVLDLHASAKLGEREGIRDQWPAWVWWNNRGWTANVVRPDSFEERTFLPDEAREFQIELAKVKAKNLRFSLDVDSGGELQRLPQDGYEQDGRKWLNLRW
jgi:hypothetical protein